MRTLMRKRECEDCAAAEHDPEWLCVTSACLDCEVREIARMDAAMQESFFDRAERQAGREARIFLQDRVREEGDRIAALRTPVRRLRGNRIVE
ncbi:MAG: hypothetical protein PGN26_14475 [Xylophilus ampelinus]